MRLDGAKSVWQTKLAIASAVGIPASCQRAILDGEELYDARPLSECRVRNGCTLQLLRRSFGGSAGANAPRQRVRVQPTYRSNTGCLALQRRARKWR